MNSKLELLSEFGDLGRTAQVVMFYLPYWLGHVAVLSVLAFGVAFLLSFLRNGFRPDIAARNCFFGLVEGIRDILLLPLGMRRVYAIALLSFKEAIRRRILYVFVLFLVPFLFAGWYLPNRAEGQVLFLVAFVNNAITWLLLPLVVILTSMNLPNDLKNKTIQTVVTKPIRRLEIVVGRVLGFVAIYTIVLLVMGGISLVYINGTLTAAADALAQERKNTFLRVLASTPGSDNEPGVTVREEYSRAGLQPGDRVLGIHNPVASSAAFAEKVKALKSTEPFAVVVQRGNKVESVAINPSDERKTALVGSLAKAATTAEEPGIVAAEDFPDARLKKGDRVLGVNQVVAGYDALNERLRQRSLKDGVELVIQRDGKAQLVELTFWERLKDSTARVPIYASAPSEPELKDKGFVLPLMFKKQNQFQAVGTNVGKEAQKRSHIQGAPGDAAHWFFEFDPATFHADQPVRLMLRFNIYKTTKGDPTRDVGPNAKGSGVYCLLTIYDRANPKSKLYSTTFRADNDRLHSLDELTNQPIPYAACASGKLEVVAECLTQNQFLGMAAEDLYFLAAERSFSSNFLKGLVSIWLKLVLLTSVAVAASTVLNGFVTILLTTMIYILGICYQFMLKVVTGEVKGGGPLESFIRLYQQNNQSVDLDPGLAVQAMKMIDYIVLKVMSAVSSVVPNIGNLDTAWLVAEGIDIPLGLILMNFAYVFAYVVPVLVAGYFLLRNREIAA